MKAHHLLYNRRRGFTVLELLMGCALIPLLCGGIVWTLRVAFLTQATLERDVDTLDRALHLTMRVARDAAGSRGLVRFTPAGSSQEMDGLLMRDNQIFTYALGNDGQVRQIVYSYPHFELQESTSLGRGFSYFHLVQLERGIHMNVDVGEDPTAAKAPSTSAFIDMATAVQPRRW